MYLLDTDHFSILQRHRSPEFAPLSGRIGAIDRDAFFVSIVTFHEQTAGWNAYLNRAVDLEGVVRAYEMMALLLSDFAAAQVVAFDTGIASVFGSLRAQGVRVGTLDLRIAATAISRNFTLLSRNLVHFRKVPGLRVEDWTA